MRWEVKFGLLLVGLSSVLYLFQDVIFGDPHHIAVFIVEHVAFIPIEVLAITLIIEGILNAREKTERVEKLHVVVEAFFGEIGNRLLAYFVERDPDADGIRDSLLMNAEWDDDDFQRAKAKLRDHDHRVTTDGDSLRGLRRLLMEERFFFLGLLTSPSLLEHEFFTDLLLAVSHLSQELSARPDLDNLPEADYQHLSADMSRAYRFLVLQWIDFARYLKANYPYLFSISVRTNPFDKEASAIVR